LKAVVFTGAGGPEVMRIEARPDPIPDSREVLIEVSHAGLNPADLAQRAGRYPAPPGAPVDVPGIEVAGQVVACGAAVRRWRENDRVFGIVGGGGLADRVLADEDHVTAVPVNLDPVAAAAAPEAFVTAHDAVFSQAGLGPGDVLLVTGANGGVGTAAIQLARAAGARVIAAVRSAEVRDRLAALGAEAVDAAQFVTAARAAGGADVVLELVGAPNLDADLDALALKGRIVIVGTSAGTDGGLALRKLMSKRGRILGTGLRTRSPAEKAAVIAGFAHSVVPLLADGRVRPIVDRVFPAAELAAAYAHLEGAGKLGKVVIEFEAV